MASITNDCIKIEGITEKYLLIDFWMNIEPNDHGHAKITLRMVDDGKGENLLVNMENRMVTVKSMAKDNIGTIFKGYIESCTVCPQIDGEIVEIGLVTTTIKADIERKNISFQKKELSYGEVIDKTADDDSAVCNYIDDKIKSRKIKKPIIRYNETLWEFIGRLSSRYHLQVVPDETADKPTFSVGLKKEGSASDNGFFKKEYKDFINISSYINRKLKDEECNVVMKDYMGMEVRSFNTYKIGMKVIYNGNEMVICAKRAETEGAQIVFTYILGREQLYSTEKKYNYNLHGRCLEGKVVKCENERVKMQLNIDVDSGNEKSEGELYWFNWQPDTGNLMYCMPEKDTVVSLYVGGKDEGNSIVINALRKDKGRDIDVPERRYLTSIDNKRMMIKSKEIGFSMEDNDEGNTRLILNDDIGIQFITNKKIRIQADGKITVNGRNTVFTAPKEVELLNKKANVQVNKRINIKGNMTYLGYGVTAPEFKDSMNKLNTSRIMSQDKYESNLERMSQEIMEGYFNKDDGRLSKSDCASLAKSLIMVHEMTDVSERKNNLPPESGDVLCLNKQIGYYDGSGKYSIKYAWEENDTEPSTRSMEVLKKGEKFDRVGPETGKCVGKVSTDGTCAKIEERSVPYYFSGNDIESEPSYHRYETIQDFTKENLEKAIDDSSFYTDCQKEQMRKDLAKYYKDSEKKYGKGDGLTTGKIAPMFGKTGGGIQHDMPFGMDMLQNLGMIKAV